MSNEETLRLRAYVDRSMRRTKNRLFTLLIVVAGGLIILLSLPH